MPGEREACIHFRSSHFPSPPKPRTGPPPAARLAIPTMHEPRHAPRSSQLITKPTPPLSPTARTGLSQYEEEVGYDVVAATVTDSRKGAGAVDEIEFKVVSWRRGADCSAAAADDDTASNFSNDADADSSDSESIASLGSVAAQPSRVRKQAVWRTLREFRHLHAELAAAGTPLAAFPATPSWLSLLWTDSRDRAESLRCDLDCLLKVSNWAPPLALPAANSCIGPNL